MRLAACLAWASLPSCLGGSLRIEPATYWNSDFGTREAGSPLVDLVRSLCVFLVMSVFDRMLMLSLGVFERLRKPKQRFGLKGATKH